MARFNRGRLLALLLVLPLWVACEDSTWLPDRNDARDVATTDEGTLDADTAPAEVADGAGGEEVSGQDMPADAAGDEAGDPGTLPGCTTTLDCASMLSMEPPSPCARPYCDTVAGQCAWGPMPNGVACTLQDPCVEDARCQAGECVGRAKDCDDDNPCTADSCAAGGACQHAPQDGACDDGNPCTSGDTCAAGLCTGSNNTCTCGEDADCIPREDGDRCNGTLKCEGEVCVVDRATVVFCEATASPCRKAACAPATGECVQVPAGEGAPCDDGSLCTLGDHCAAGECVGTRTIPCDDQNPCTDDSCDALGGCVFTPNAKACDDGNRCTVDDTCADGLCAGTVTAECGCVQDADCAAKEDGDRCNGTLVCRLGRCVVDPATVRVCDPLPEDAGACRVPTCDPATGECVPTALTDGRPCDDGNACTPASACQDGTCVGSGLLDCDDDSQCTADSCDPDSGCVHVALTGSCDDGSVCTLGDTCIDGQCSPTSWKVCADGNPCTADSCDASLGCVFTDVSGPCSDGNLCTVGDACQEGRCVPGDPDPCLDENPCTDDSCDPDRGCVHVANTAGCNDGDPCTTGDLCGGGTCNAGTPVNCDDGDPCTVEKCVSSAGGCLKENAKDGTPCDDGNGCTPADACVAGLCVGSGGCDDGNPCTADWCDETRKECMHENLDIGCDDGDPCTVGDHCIEGDCQAGGQRDCQDGDLCNGKEWCLPGTGCQAGTPPDCDDGAACNGVETCDPATGCVPGTAPDCDDDNTCTEDGCDDATGCWNRPQAGIGCDDGSACTKGDACDADGACVGAPVVCDDANACNGKEWCDPASGCRLGVPLICDDGDICNGRETCDAAAGCVAGTPLPCMDEDPCTDDLCDPLDGCYFPYNTAPCDDGDACTGKDTCAAGQCLGTAIDCTDPWDCTLDGCDPATGCTHQPDDRMCNDENVCTQDVCDPDLGCRFVPIEGGCDDGNPCTPNDVCFKGQCVGTGFLDCSDTIDCTVDSCQPDVPGGCVHAPDGTRCFDANACTDDVCDPQQGCQNPPNTARCDDNNFCTDDDQCLNGECMPGTQVVCNDGVDCTMDWCNPLSGCQYQPYDLSCADQDPCTDDVCDATEGCLHLPGSGAACDDGNPCTTGDVCVTGACVGPVEVVCDDGFDCTVDKCDLETGDCIYAPDDSLCDNSDPCIAQACMPDGTGTTAGKTSIGPPTGCVSTFTTAPCDDGNPCTAQDTCNGQGQCLGETWDCSVQGCDTVPICPETACTDGSDNNNNGLADCWDPACAGDESCFVKVGWCRLQWPDTVIGTEGTFFPIYSRAWVDGVTTASPYTDAYPALRAEIGVGPHGTVPDPANGWAFTNSVPNTGYGPDSPSWEANNDEYWSDIPIRPYPGPYDYAARYSGDNGLNWVYCDRNAGAGSDGSEDGYQVENAGLMKVEYALEVQGTDYAVVPRGARLAVQGRGFTEVTEVTIGGIVQPVTVVSDHSLEIPAVASGTPTGVQTLVVTAGTYGSASTSVEVLELSFKPAVLAHGAALVLTGEGLSAITGVLVGYAPQAFVTQSDAMITVTNASDDIPLGVQPLQVDVPAGRSAPLYLTVIHLVINEQDADQPSTDTAEFVEIATGVPFVTVSDYVLVLWNGSTNLSYGSFDIAATADANGLILAGSAGVVPTPAILMTGTGGVATNVIQNGQDATAIYQGSASAFPANSSLTSLGLIDALVYDTGQADDAELLAVLLGTGPESLQVDEWGGLGSTVGIPNSIQRCAGSARRDGRVWSALTPPSPGLPNLCP